MAINLIIIIISISLILWIATNSIAQKVYKSHTCFLCRVELVVQFPARGSTQVLLCLFPGVVWLWHVLYSYCPYTVASLHNIQLITYHEVNMVKWRTIDLVLEVVWPERGRRPRSGQTTESTRSRDLHFTKLAEWKVFNCFIIPKKISGQYTSLTGSIFNTDQVNIQ